MCVSCGKDRVARKKVSVSEGKVRCGKIKGLKRRWVEVERGTRKTPWKGLGSGVGTVPALARRQRSGAQT